MNSEKPRSNVPQFAVGLVIALLFVVVILLWRDGNRTPQETRGTSSSDVPGTEPNLTQPSRASSKGDEFGARNLIHSAIAALRKSNSTGESRRVLAQLAGALNALPKEDASRAVQEILSSGIDAQTHLEFEVGPEGRLSGANTLRIFLLDYLGGIDPAAAAESAVKILSRLESPDEWAVSLRNYARSNSSPDSRNFLRDRTRVLLTHQPWQQNPSTGYLEAFDVAVHIGGSEWVPELTRLLGMTNHPAAAHAADLAIDRLVIQDPAPVLSVLANEAGWMQGRETTRAGLFARADVSDLAQRRVLETYLLNPVLDPIELGAFADLFPNENYRISHNLLTQTAPRPGSAIQRRDRESLRVVEQWITEDRFQGVRPHLMSIRKRLKEFLKADAGLEEGGIGP